MTKPQTAPYGAWRSPIAAARIAAGSARLEDAIAAGSDVYWLESRAAEGGRSVIVVLGADGRPREITPPPFNVRSRVHEYGGGAFTVADGAIYFCNFADQRLYVQAPGQAPAALTAAGALRYADLVVDRRHNRLICVVEDHSAPGARPTNYLAGVDLGTGAVTTLVAGSDFYASPRLAPDGRSVCWLSWNQPDMPWDSTQLFVADVAADGALGAPQQVAGGPEVSIFQPEFAPDGLLHFVSDATGWWNLYRHSGGKCEALTDLQAEFGLPQWQFGMSTYAFAAPGLIVCAYTERGTWRLAKLDTATRRLSPIAAPYTVLTGLRAAQGKIVLRAGSPTEAAAVLRLDPDTGQTEVLHRSLATPPDPAYLSTPRPIEFPTSGGLFAHGLYYPPQNGDFAAPPAERPPLLVCSHGGPTSAAVAVLDLSLQYWTSRGFAVLDVNYGGSTGYGRAYRQRLRGRWGSVDVADCAAGARYLAARGEVDGERLAIRGGSAGGYTTLCALTFDDTFKAGCSLFGVSDLELLAADTHKFEARYLDSLIGPWPAARDTYRQRSPIHFAERLACPVIFFQGLEDRVVPPNQAERMVEVLRAKGLPVAYVAFAGEGHGFRAAENIRRCLEGELYFYARVFGFALAEPVEPVPIDNL